MQFLPKDCTRILHQKTKHNKKMKKLNQNPILEFYFLYDLALITEIIFDEKFF